MTYCKNNLHQWGIALSAYTTDFNVYPIYAGSIYRGPALIYGTFTWFGLLQPYTGANWTNIFISGGLSGPQQPQPPGIHVCPDYVRLGGWFSVRGGVPETGDPSFGSYGYNAEGYSIDESLGLGWEAPAPNPTIILPVRESEVVCPSDMIAIGDAMLFPMVPGQAFPPAVSGFDDLNPMADGEAFLTELGLFPRAGMIDYQTQRHGGRWNVLYCDGHVLGESTEQFLDPRSDAVLRELVSQPRATRGLLDSLLAEVRRTRAGDVLAAEGGRVSSGSREVCGGAPRRNKPHTNAVGRGSQIIHAKAVARRQL